MKKRAVITGIGLINALGNSFEDVCQSLKNNKCGLESQFIDSIINEKYIGKVNCNLEKYVGMDKTEKMSRKAITDALKDSHVNMDNMDTSRVSLSYATTILGTDQIIEFVRRGSSDFNLIGNTRNYMREIAKDFQINGFVYNSSTACSASTNSVGIALDLIKNNKADLVIAGGSDHITNFSIYGFHSLKSLSSHICKPFDKDRDGINIGEGSAFFIIEDYDFALARNAKIYGEILGYGLANDAYHITSPDPNGVGAKIAMNMAIEEAQVSNDDIEYINAHGTGTKANDIMEIKAINAVFGKKCTISSTKSRTGHCLGAAGAIELALSIIGVSNSALPTTYNSKCNIEDFEMVCEVNRDIKTRCFISNSFAFAGNASAIIVKTMG